MSTWRETSATDARIGDIDKARLLGVIDGLHATIDGLTEANKRLADANRELADINRTLVRSLADSGSERPSEPARSAPPDTLRQAS